MNPPERLAMLGSGLSLVVDAAGATDAPTILFLHGSGQTRRSWRRALAVAGARGYRAYAPDLRGHGDSDWSADGKYTLDLFAADIRRVVEQIGGEPVLVGASLGGMIGMMIAANPPPRLRALVLVDIAPRIERQGAQEVFAFMDGAAGGFASLDDAADAVAAYLPHRGRPASVAGLECNLRLRGGRYYWHWDPAFMQMGRDYSDSPDVDKPNPFPALARAITVPTLLVRGGRSRILTDEGAREFLGLVPHAHYADIAGAHHMVAGDANDAFNDAVLRFVDAQFGPALETTRGL